MMKRLFVLILLLFSISVYSKDKYTSKYTDLSKDCKGEEDIKEGDVPQICEGPSGYYIYISYSACSEFLSIRSRKDKSEIQMPEQLFANSAKKKLEWRLKNGKPIAVIYRVNIFEEADDPCNRKKKGETLEIRGLGKNSSLVKSIPSGKIANENARAEIDGFMK